MGFLTQWRFHLFSAHTGRILAACFFLFYTNATKWQRTDSKGTGASPRDLGPFTGGSHQTCISRALSPALTGLQPRERPAVAEFLSGSETPRDVSPVFQSGLLPEIIVYLCRKGPCCFPPRPAPRGLRRGKVADVITPPGIRVGAGGSGHTASQPPRPPLGQPCGAGGRAQPQGPVVKIV